MLISISPSYEMASFFDGVSPAYSDFGMLYVLLCKNERMREYAGYY